MVFLSAVEASIEFPIATIKVEWGSKKEVSLDAKPLPLRWPPILDIDAFYGL